ncbi:hypothetical protein EBT16_08810 [bacterium]|nr:hypothetical protein [bacterium]
MKTFSPFFFALAFLLSSSGLARMKDFAVNSSWKLYLGASVSSLEKRFSAPPGFASKVSQIQGLLGVTQVFKLSKRFDIKPEVFVLLPWRKGADGTTLTFTSHLGFLLGYKISKRGILNFGNGLLWEMYCSKGQDILLNNGNGTSNFYTPSRWTQVVLPTATVSFEWQLKSLGASVQLGALVSEFLKSEKRSFRGMARLAIDL